MDKKIAIINPDNGNYEGSLSLEWAKDNVAYLDEKIKELSNQIAIYQKIRNKFTYSIDKENEPKIQRTDTH